MWKGRRASDGVPRVAPDDRVGRHARIRNENQRDRRAACGPPTSGGTGSDARYAPQLRYSNRQTGAPHGQARAIATEEILRTTTLLFGAALAAAAFPAFGQSPDPNVARNLAATCANCHGTSGVSVGVTASLAGMGKDEMVGKLQDFKTGKKPATIMHQLAKGYTDAQIEQLAGWFSAQKAPGK
jgi:sulfide dehydrogenase cytochrome subunit